MPATPPFHPRPEALPPEVAVFPLPGALLLPGGRLPLNIFEPRYLALVEDALASGRMFAMIQPDPSAARPEGGGPSALYKVGCLGRVTSFAETEDGRLLITLLGLARFRAAEELPMSRRGYRRVRADYGPWLDDLSAHAEPPGARPAFDRAALIAALRPYFKARRIEANWDAIEGVADPMLVTTLSMVCPFEVREKQALLEAPTHEERARVLTALLQMEAALGAAGSAGSGGGTDGPTGKPS